MTKDTSYSAVSNCLNRVKTSNIDQMLKIRLECQFIRLKRCILCGPVHLAAEDILVLEELSEEIAGAEHKEAAIVALKRKIDQLLKEAEEFRQAPAH
jgi:hypothetical protein